MLNLCTSVTRWDTGPYRIMVHVGFFETKALAEAFGRQPMHLVQVGPRLVLVSPDGEHLGDAGDDYVEVFLYNPESDDPKVVANEGWEAVDLRIADFAATLSLSSCTAPIATAQEFENETAS